MLERSVIEKFWRSRVLERIVGEESCGEVLEKCAVERNVVEKRWREVL